MRLLVFAYSVKIASNKDMCQSMIAIQIPNSYYLIDNSKKRETIMLALKTQINFIILYALAKWQATIFMCFIIFIIFNIWMISSLRKLTSVALSLQMRPAMRFADNWKDRDEASEKVYISQAEKDTLKRLLKKVEEEQEDQESSLEEFDRKLALIMKRYKIDNTTMRSEILALHKNLS